MDSSLFLIGVNGFLISLGLIVAIGPQNAFVLRKGLRRRHVFAVAMTCFLADAVLILLGAAGVGALAKQSATATSVLTFGGAAFLLWFGYNSFRNAKNPQVLTDESMEEVGDKAKGKGVGAAIITGMALTFLNPHALLDTLVIIGGITTQYDSPGLEVFVGGALLASFVWFFALGYGARLLEGLFRKPIAWTILDICIGLIMWGVSFSLIFSELSELGII